MAEKTITFPASSYRDNVMGDYVKKEKSHPRDADIHELLLRIVKTSRLTPQSPTIDTNQITDAVSKAVAEAIENNLKNLPTSVYNQEKSGTEKGNAFDAFDESKSLSRLAESMTVQRGNSTSNFEDLGGINTSKKDSKETQSTIDLLTNLDD